MARLPRYSGTSMPPETARYALEPPLPAFCTCGSELQHVIVGQHSLVGSLIKPCNIVLLEGESLRCSGDPAVPDQLLVSLHLLADFCCG